jgi:hypothetical protein
MTLAAMNLTAINARLDALLEAASKKKPSYPEFLLEVMSAEADARGLRYAKTRLQLAHLPYVKTLPLSRCDVSSDTELSGPHG